MEKAKADSHQLALEVIRKFASNDVFLIAETVGLKIVYENWFPVTIGEFDKKKKTIFVNLSANESHIKIIAHELGHFFAQDLDIDRSEEEIFAHQFAENLITDKKLKN